MDVVRSPRAGQGGQSSRSINTGAASLVSLLFLLFACAAPDRVPLANSSEFKPFQAASSVRKCAPELLESEYFTPAFETLRFESKVSKLDIRLFDYVHDVTLLELQILFRIHDHVGQLVAVVRVPLLELLLRYAEVAHSVAHQVRDLLPLDLHAHLLVLRDVVAVYDRVRRASQLLDRALLRTVDACGAVWWGARKGRREENEFV